MDIHIDLEHPAIPLLPQPVIPMARLLDSLRLAQTTPLRLYIINRHRPHWSMQTLMQKPILMQMLTLTPMRKPMSTTLI
jgi:hypothetical protein